MAIEQQLKKLPMSPGVYFFKNKEKKVIYVGKANILKNRVRQYFALRANDSSKIIALRNEIAHIEWRICESSIDALIEEAKYIKAYRPKFNVVLRDDKNYFFACITAEKEYPRIFLSHQPKNDKKLTSFQRGLKIIGPFTHSMALKETVRNLRRIYPYCTSKPSAKPCFDYHLGKCLGACAHPEARAQDKKNIQAIADILQGKRQSIIKKLEKEMNSKAREEKFSEAEDIKHKIIHLQKIFAHRPSFERSEMDIEQNSSQWHVVQKKLQQLLKLNSHSCISRVEGYDISNISGKYAVGSMVVFVDGIPEKSEYRKFKIKYSGDEPNDTKMIKEVLERRITHDEWQTPDLILIDGGKGQLSSAVSVLPPTQQIISIAKREEEIYMPSSQNPIPSLSLGNETALFIRRVRDEAHRFAVSYHRVLRSKAMRATRGIMN